MIYLILESIFGITAIVLMGFSKPWESYLFLAISFACVIISLM